MWDIMLKSERQFETRMVVPLFPMFASGCSPHPGQPQNSTSFPPSHMSQESFAQLSASAVPPRNPLTAVWPGTEHISLDPHFLPGCTSVTCSGLAHWRLGRLCFKILPHYHGCAQEAGWSKLPSPSLEKGNHDLSIAPATFS